MDKLSTILEQLDFTDEEKRTWERLCLTLKPEGQIELVKFLETLLSKQQQSSTQK